MVRPSFVPPVWQRELRDLCRYRRTLTQERTREKQRVEKLLEDTQIKLSAVISDIFGVSGRAMLDALVAGQRDPRVLAELARASMRRKIGVLAEALTGHFRDHHGYLLAMMLGRVDALTAQIEQLTMRIDLGSEGIDAAEHHGQQVAVVVAEVPGERLGQGADLAAHAGPGQLRERARVTLPGDERGHASPG